MVSLVDAMEQASRSGNRAIGELKAAERRLLGGRRGFVLIHSFGRVVYDPTNWGPALHQRKLCPVMREVAHERRHPI